MCYETPKRPEVPLVDLFVASARLKHVSTLLKEWRQWSSEILLECHPSMRSGLFRDNVVEAEIHRVRLHGIPLQARGVHLPSRLTLA